MKIENMFDRVFDIVMLGAGIFVYIHQGVITCMAFFGMLAYIKLCEINISMESYFTKLQHDKREQQ